MLIEALMPLCVRLRTGEIHLRPGRPVHFSDADARKLLDRVPGKVRVVASPNREQDALTGQIVSWESPLFGLLRATVLETLPHGVRVVHPLTEVDCVIPLTWLCRGLDGDGSR